MGRPAKNAKASTKDTKKKSTVVNIEAPDFDIKADVSEVDVNENEGLEPIFAPDAVEGAVDLDAPISTETTEDTLNEENVEDTTEDELNESVTETGEDAKNDIPVLTPEEVANKYDIPVIDAVDIEVEITFDQQANTVVAQCPPKPKTETPGAYVAQKPF